jgi:hypothetical protein
VAPQIIQEKAWGFVFPLIMLEIYGKYAVIVNEIATILPISLRFIFSEFIDLK